MAWTWRFRKTFNPLPFLRINLSRSGLSLTGHLGKLIGINSRHGDISVNPPGPGPTFHRRGNWRRSRRR